MLTVLIVIGMAVALAGGVYVGLGFPGLRGREDRVVAPGRARRLPKQHIHWLRPNSRR